MLSASRGGSGDGVVIDFHSFIQPKSFLNRLRARRTYPRIEVVDGKEVICSSPGVYRPLRHEQNDIERRLAMLLRAGVTAQVLRLQNVSGVDALGVDEGLETAMAANDEVAAICRAHPSHFIPFATVPLGNAERATAELQRAASIGHRGVALSVAYDATPIDHPRFRPILETADQLGMVVLLLPNHPSTIDPMVKPFDWLSAALGFQVDLGLATLRLLLTGVANAFPKVRFVVMNLGGIVPFVTERLDHFWERLGRDHLDQCPSTALRRFFYGTASSSPGAIRLAAQVLGSDRLVFGSDYPSFDPALAVANVRASGLAHSEQDLILGINGVGLLTET